MAQIYILEKYETRQKQTAQGEMTTKRVTLRELNGDSEFTKRHAVDYLGPGDLKALEGCIVATQINEGFKASNGDNLAFSSLNCREIISFGKAGGEAF